MLKKITLQLTMNVELATHSPVRSGTVVFTGKLNKKMAFPACVLTTNAGCVPNLTGETLSYLTKGIIPNISQVSVPSVAEYEDTISAYSGSAAEFFNLSSSVLYVSLQDYLVNSRVKTDSSYGTNKTVSIWGNGGRIALDVAKYMQLMDTLSPDLYEVLADGDTISEDVSKKRVSKSFTKSLTFLKDCLMHHDKSERLSNSYLVPALEGGNSIELRKKYVQEMLQMLKEYVAGEKCGGFIVDGISHTASLNEDLLSLVRSSTENLPTDKLRIIHGPRTHHDVFALLECGVDMFDASYPCNAASQNRALVYSYPYLENSLDDEDKVTANMKENKLSDLPELDLSSKNYKESFEPISTHCECYTCKTHTMAYIHHLVSTKEMLAAVLLTLHNLHHYLSFFDALRSAISLDRYKEFKMKCINKET